MFFPRKQNPGSSSSSGASPSPSQPQPGASPQTRSPADSKEDPGLEAVGMPDPAAVEAREEAEAEAQAKSPAAQATRKTASFRLIDSQGNALAGKRGLIRFSDGRELNFRSGADGRYFVGELPENTTYTLVFGSES